MERIPRSTKPNSSASSTKSVPWRALNLLHLGKSFRFAFAGIRYAWRNEPNFRIELSIGFLAFCLSLWLGVSPVTILIISAAVLSLELSNSAIEAAIDLISPDFHPLAKRAKDAAAGAVLVSSVIAVIIGLFVLGPPLLTKLGFL